VPEIVKSSLGDSMDDKILSKMQQLQVSDRKPNTKVTSSERPSFEEGVYVNTGTRGDIGHD
jgi:hypothetical protein